MFEIIIMFILLPFHYLFIYLYFLKIRKQVSCGKLVSSNLKPKNKKLEHTCNPFWKQIITYVKPMGGIISSLEAFNKITYSQPSSHVNVKI